MMLSCRVFVTLSLVLSVHGGFLSFTTVVNKSSQRWQQPSRVRVVHAAAPQNTCEAAPTTNVVILENADAVGADIRQRVEEAAKQAIAERGHFALAIPGGSILKMLVGSGGGWTKDTTLVYVNHKCVDMQDEKLSTHAKATKLFLKEESWNGCNVLELAGTDDAVIESLVYKAKMAELSNEKLPKKNGLPIFDMALIGVGDDGHVGSLYPGREEVSVGDDGPWVLPVDMKKPPSITLSLPVMKNAKQVIIAACGVSEKYPLGKSDAMKRAIEATEETLSSFPAVGLRDVATWVLDEAAASKLSDGYKKTKGFFFAD